ncbi:MAG: transposase [Pyrinomonadaceae bacterium]
MLCFSVRLDNLIAASPPHRGVASGNGGASIGEAELHRKEEVVAFVGLDPLEKRSGEKRRIGSISKHGSRLMRHLLGQAAQACRDKRIRQFYSQVSRRRGRPKAKVAAARKPLINCARLPSLAASVMRNSCRVGRSWSVRGLRRVELGNPLSL